MRVFLKYVNDRLKGKAEKGQKRSKEWTTLRKRVLKNSDAKCAVCGSTKKLELHHILPFNLFPDLELEEGNLIILCDGNGRFGIKSCHLLFGHYGNFKLYNPNVHDDAFVWNHKITKAS